MRICNLEVQTVKKDIKNMHLGVYPPNGKVRVAVPLNVNDESIRLFIISKLPWIKKHRTHFQNQARETMREYVSGESHYLFGNRHLLNVISSNEKNSVSIEKKSTINLYTSDTFNRKKKELLLNNFYRRELKKSIPSFVKKWSKITGVSAKEVNIKKMKTKWGSSNPDTGRIWLNLELAKNRLVCTEYVLAHEMTHFIEKNHTPKFHSLMDLFMPKWNQYKQELNSSILSFNEWN